jgi:hypothetical protein
MIAYRPDVAGARFTAVAARSASWVCEFRGGLSISGVKVTRALVDEYNRRMAMLIEWPSSNGALARVMLTDGRGDRCRADMRED